MQFMQLMNSWRGRSDVWRGRYGETLARDRRPIGVSVSTDHAMHMACTGARTFGCVVLRASRAAGIHDIELYVKLDLSIQVFDDSEMLLTC